MWKHQTGPGPAGRMDITPAIVRVMCTPPRSSAFSAPRCSTGLMLQRDRGVGAWG